MPHSDSRFRYPATGCPSNDDDDWMEKQSTRIAQCICVQLLALNWLKLTRSVAGSPIKLAISHSYQTANQSMIFPHCSRVHSVWVWRSITVTRWLVYVLCVFMMDMSFAIQHLFDARTTHTVHIWGAINCEWATTREYTVHNWWFENKRIENRLQISCVPFDRSARPSGNFCSRTNGIGGEHHFRFCRKINFGLIIVRVLITDRYWSS